MKTIAMMSNRLGSCKQSNGNGAAAKLGARLRDRFAYLVATESREAAKIIFVDEVNAFIRITTNQAAMAAAYQARQIIQS